MALIFFFLTISQNKETRSRNFALLLSVVGMIICFLSINQNSVLFLGTYKIDFFSQFFKTLLGIGFFLIIFLGKELKGISRSCAAPFYLFLTLSLLGLIFLISSVELITLFVSLELSSYALYIAICFRKNGGWQTEAAIKYLLFGAIASGLMLFGIGYLLLALKDTYISSLVTTIPVFPHNIPVILGFCMLLSGVFFKLALFPFHFWSPDVYQGASNETTPFIATLPKVAAIALLLRFLNLETGQPALIQSLVLLSAASMTFGNLVALAQQDLKRLLAYSSIAHAGYILMGLLAFNQIGAAAAVYYITVYLMMNLACFYVIAKISPQGKNVSFSGLSGLYRRSPWLAATLAVSALSLAGIPPTAGFTGKLFLFTAAFKAGHNYLVVLAAINCAISLFFYLNMVRHAYTREPEGLFSVPLSGFDYLISIFFIFIIIFLGILPNSLFNIALNVITNLV